MKTVFPAAATVVTTTSADELVYTGAGLITTIGVDPEGAECEITVRDDDGDILWNISTAADGEYRGQNFTAGLPFNKGIRIYLSSAGRGMVAFVKKA